MNAESPTPESTKTSVIESPRDPSEYGGDEVGSPTREAPLTEEERIDEAIDESFPASDPPAP
jgi:hypothetical protein